MLWINIAGLLLIAVIVYWFWLSKPRAQISSGRDAIEIVVEKGVYTPSRLMVKVGTPVTLRFLRRDPSPCAEQVIFHDLGISETLAVGQPKEITIILDRAGEYRFTCQMQMYVGTLVAG